MSVEPSNAKFLPRWFAILMTSTHLSWFWIAPEIHKSRDHFDHAAWVPLILLPTGAVGFIVGLCFIKEPSRKVAVPFFLVLVAHVAVGLW